jgi:riboflavin biosynthesis pyrimidine reductase
MEIVWYTAMSMDGRIASADESLGFLETAPGSGDDFDDFIAGVDAVLVGAATLRWLVAEGAGWPHDDLPTWLVSHVEALAESVRPTRAPLVRVSGDLAPALEGMEAGGCRRVWLAGGGSVAGQVLALDRLDEVVATIAPTALGSGPALFDALALPQRTFDLVDCRAIGPAARLRWVRRKPV